MTSERILEIRSYRLRDGTSDEFARRVAAVLPVLRRHGIDVVGHGPSLVDEDGEHYVLLRSFASAADRDRLEDAFYGSDDWRSGPRAGILELIEGYHTVVLRSTDDAVSALAASLDPSARPAINR